MGNTVTNLYNKLRGIDPHTELDNDLENPTQAGSVTSTVKKESRIETAK
jgi:hypothetical protein